MWHLDSFSRFGLFSGVVVEDGSEQAYDWSAEVSFWFSQDFLGVETVVLGSGKLLWKSQILLLHSKQTRLDSTNSHTHLSANTMPQTLLEINLKAHEQILQNLLTSFLCGCLPTFFDNWWLCQFQTSHLRIMWRSTQRVSVCAPVHINFFVDHSHFEISTWCQNMSEQICSGLLKYLLCDSIWWVKNVFKQYQQLY